MPNANNKNERTLSPVTLEEALAALHESETRLRGLFESDLIGIGFSDAAGRILDVNAAFLRMVGYSREDFTSGRVGWLDITPPEYLPLDQKAIEVLRRTGRAEPIAKEFIRQDGSRISVLLAGKLLEGTEDKFACVAIDLTESRQAAQTLHETQQQYLTLVESLPQLVWTTRADGVLDYVSPQWYDYTGCGLEETIHRGGGFFLPLEDQEQAASAWQKAVEIGKPYVVEYRLPGKDGLFRWFLARGVPIKDAQGHITHWFGTCTDINDQKHEEEKQRFLACLSQEIRTLTAPDGVMWTAMRLLGEHLRASRSTYNEVDEENDLVTADRDYCTEGESILGTFPLSAFGPALLDDLRAGSTAVIVDTATDPRTAPAFETMYERIGVRSFIAAPLIKEGRLVTILSVNMTAPREWTADDAELVEEVAERTWLAVENARLFQAARREVEERKRAEEYSNRVAAIVETSQDAIVSKDLHGIVTSWNAAAERIYGYAAEEIIGRSKALLIPSDRPHELATILNRVRRGERIEPYDTVRRRKDGSRIAVSISVSPVIDANGQIIGASTIARDITERIRAEEERARLTVEIDNQRKRLDDLLGSVPGVVWEAWGQPDQENQRINFVSDHVEAMLGYTVQEWVSTPNFWLTIVHPEDREQATRVALEAWAGGSQHINGFRWIRKDGQALWCESHSVVIKDAEGAPIGMRGVTIDVSERKQAEAERDRHLAEIEVLNEQLERAMTETHHRVRNSLQTIAALMEIEAPEAGATVAAEEFQRIGGYVRALAAVHDLLTKRAKKDSTATDISARAVLQNLVDLVRQTAGRQCIVADIEDTLLSIQQGTSLAVVAHELMTNALKYGHGGIEIRFLVREGTATLEVTDDGPGFKESFNPQESGNTGLELVSQVARWDLRADKMHFNTRPEGGGRVTIHIPLAIDTSRT